MQNENFCFIDIGTNRIKCLIYTDGKEILLGNKEVRAEDFVAENQAVLDIETIRKNLLLFLAEATDQHKIPPQGIKIVATEGLRKASNSDILLERLNNVFHDRFDDRLKIDIISPQREAELAIKGMLSKSAQKNGSAIVIESGGGSTEVSFVKKNKNGQFDILGSVSIPFGNTNTDLKNNAQEIQQQIASKIQELTSSLKQPVDEKTELIINARVMAQSVSKKHNLNGKWGETEGKSVNVGYLLRGFDYTLDNEQKGKETAFLLKNILTNLKISNFAMATNSLQGVKEGLLQEKLESLQKERTIVNEANFIQEENKDWQPAYQKNWQDWAAQTNQELTTERSASGLSLKFGNKLAPQAEINYTSASHIKMKCAADKEENDLYFAQLIKLTKECGAKQIKLKAGNSQAFNEKLLKYATQYGIPVVIENPAMAKKIQNLKNKTTHTDEKSKSPSAPTRKPVRRSFVSGIGQRLYT